MRVRRENYTPYPRIIIYLLSTTFKTVKNIIKMVDNYKQKRIKSEYIERYSRPYIKKIKFISTNNIKNIIYYI